MIDVVRTRQFTLIRTSELHSRHKKKKKMETLFRRRTMRHDVVAFSGATIIVINDCRARLDRSINLPLLSRL